MNYLFNRVFNTKIKLPPSGKMVISTGSGNIYLLTNQTSYLTQLLFWKGYKNFEYSDIFEKLSKDVDSFFDIGSNIGYYSILAAKSNPKIKVFAFEPAVGPYHYLKENIQLNRMEEQIKFFKLALSNKNGSLTFYEVANKKYSYLKYNLAGEGNAGTKKTSRNFITNEVKTLTLDNFIEANEISNIDLIKLDTEGTEIEILKSGSKCIDAFKPIIICETLYDVIEAELEDFFKTKNYSFYNHVRDKLIKVETIKRSKDDGVRNCFFVPDSKKHLIENYL